MPSTPNPPEMRGKTSPRVIPVLVNTAASGLIGNTTTETAFNRFLSCPIDLFYPGARLEFEASGLYNTGVGAGTLTFRFRYGGVAGTLLIAIPAFTLTASQTNKPWQMIGRITCRSEGATGTVFCHGRLFTRPAATEVIATDVNTANVTVNTANANDGVITAQFSVADAGHAVILHNLDMVLVA